MNLGVESPSLLPCLSSGDGSPTCQQFALEKQEMISMFKFHQWRRDMSQHIQAKQPCAAAGSKGIAAAWVWEGVQGFATAQASTVKVLGYLDK